MKLTALHSKLKSGIKFAAIALTSLLAFSGSSLAQNVVIRVTPPITNVVVGNSFVVRVNADLSATDSVSSIEIALNFDRSKLQVTSITKPSAALFNLEQTPVPPLATMNGTGVGSGQINYGVAISGSYTKADFDILEITFTTTTVGSAPLVFNTVAPRRTRAFFGGTQVGGPNVTPAGNGTVNINSASCPTPPTATIGNSTSCGGQPFNLLLSSATGTGPFDLVINGVTYNDQVVGQTIATITPANQTIFGTATPAGVYTQLDSPLEFGVKFTSSQAGFIKGIRYFTPENPDQAATITGRLWRFSDGVLLGSVTFTSPNPATSWREATFSSPVAINANTVYIASYHSTSFKNSEVINAFTTPITSGNLTALASSTPGGNGVFRYSATAGPDMPVDNGNNTNYLVDVLYAPPSYTFDLTSITDDGGCNTSGAPIQSLVVTSPDCATLPVTLLNIGAKAVDASIVLNWSTATEINNTGFEIQRKESDKGDWSAIAFVNGAGNSNFVLNYSYTDQNVGTNKYYYRLKQIDIDGHFQFSSIVSAAISGRISFSLGQNYPNPAHNSTAIPFTLARKTKLNLSVYDMNGRVIKVLMTGDKDAGNYVVPVNIAGLTSGVYYYKLTSEDFTAVKKLTIQ